MPSVTIWHRLEPRPQEGKLPRGAKKIPPDPLMRGLQAQVRDPLWMLARQWQVGEFIGDDAGSPVQATISTESVPLKSYRPSLTGAAVALEEKLPLEVHVEREPVELGLRGAVQLGLQFELMLRSLEPAIGGPAVQSLIRAFRTKYPIDAQPPQGDIPDTAADLFRLVAAGRVTDGNKLFGAAKDAPDNVPAEPAGIPPEARPTLKEFVDYRRSLYSEPDHDAAWVSRRLRYEFSIGVSQIELDATEFGGGRLDWQSFDQGPGTLPGAVSGAVTRDDWTFLPQNLTFRGMPNARWWDFERGETDFGQLDTEHVDVAKMIVVDFALLYSNDWFELPVPLEMGTLTRIAALVVTNTFGERTLIRPTEVHGQPGERWSMFKVTAAPGFADFLLLPSTLGIVIDGPDLEDVLFVRDEMAAMGWAIERTLQGQLDKPVSGYEPYFQRLAELQASAPPPQPSRPGDPDARYLLGTSVPDNWIPLVPVKTADRDSVFRRGRMEITATGLTGARAYSRILEPWHPFYVDDEAIPRAGVRVSRYLRRARGTDGSTWVWNARRIGSGTGAGSSGLAFDLVEQVPTP